MASSNRDKAIALFKPDKDGKSNWVPVEDFAKAGLQWTKNGNMRYGVAWNIRDIKWGVRRIGAARTAITHLRMEGWNEDDSRNQTQIIVPAVRRALEDDNIDCFSKLPIPSGRKEIDHRFGNKDHPDYIFLYQPENQKPEYFQVVFDVLNSVKRQMCNECRETGVRPAHPVHGFVEGDETHSDRFPCRGCYLAEPERYERLNP